MSLGSKGFRRHTKYQALAQGLDAVVGADDPEAAVDEVLTWYPRHSGTLRPLLQLGSNLERALRQPTPQPPFALQPGRARLLAAASSLSPHSAGILGLPGRLGAQVRMAAKMVAALALIVIFLAPLSRQVVGASRHSVPGQLLYPLKIHVERVQYSGATLPDVRVALGLAFLGERVAEIQVLVGQQEPIDYEMIVEVQQLVNQLLYSAAQAPEATMPDTLEYVSLQLQGYLEVLDSLAGATTTVNAAALSRVRAVCDRGAMISHYALGNPLSYREAYHAGRPELFLLPGENPLEGPPLPVRDNVATQGGMGE